MDYSLSKWKKDKLSKTWVLILILMDYSLRQLKVPVTVLLQDCLNPYSNGLLSETLTESMLHFLTFTILQKSLLFLRELVQLEWFFRKCMRLKVSFQIKMEQFSLSSLRNRQIHLRKSDAFLNNIRDLRNSYF